jgi:hypothetical protein
MGHERQPLQLDQSIISQDTWFRPSENHSTVTRIFIATLQQLLCFVLCLCILSSTAGSSVLSDLTCSISMSNTGRDAEQGIPAIDPAAVSVHCCCLLAALLLTSEHPCLNLVLFVFAVVGR